MESLLDTSFQLAVLDQDDRNHAVSRRHFVALPGKLLLPAVILPELMYHLNSIGGTHAVIKGLRTIQAGRLEIVEHQAADYHRATEILENYSDSRIDFVDACIMALAERLTITRILTFDRRDFGLYRPAHCEYFDLLP